MFGYIILLQLQSGIFLKSHLHNVTWSWIFPKANRSQSLTEDEAEKERRSLRWRTDLSLPETFGVSSNCGLLEFWMVTVSNPSLPWKAYFSICLLPVLISSLAAQFHYTRSSTGSTKRVLLCKQRQLWAYWQTATQQVKRILLCYKHRALHCARARTARTSL